MCIYTRITSFFLALSQRCPLCLQVRDVICYMLIQHSKYNMKNQHMRREYISNLTSRDRRGSFESRDIFTYS